MALTARQRAQLSGVVALLWWARRAQLSGVVVLWWERKRP